MRQLVLGRGAGLDLVGRWIAAAAAARTAGGFAIGRTMYWGPATAYLQQRMPREQAVAEVAASYQRVIDLWPHRH